MTPEIIAWFSQYVRPLAPFGDVLEVGAYNVNGSVRPVIKPLATSYVGTDMSAGDCVDRVVNNADLLTVFECQSFDTVICCECLEHDLHALQTVGYLHSLVKPGGLLAITTPTFKFPEHKYPKDYWRFGEDAYREVLFAGFEIIQLSHLKNDPIIACVGRKP